MPSEIRRKVLAALRSQGLGLVCAWLTVLALAVGSVVLAATREGASKEIQADELGGFFAPPAFTHAWLYALFAVLAVYALNTALCTWHAVAQRLKARNFSAQAWGPTFLHLGFLFALLAHLIGGFTAHDGEPVQLSSRWSALPDGREARLLELRTQVHPDGRPKATEARVAVRSPGGPEHEETLGYNQPLTSGFGRELVLLAQAGRLPSGEAAVLARTRSNPGLPVLLVGALLSALGVALMGRRWVRFGG